MISVGIDEVGRGCWAGPLVAGAVVLLEPIAGLRDSKKLSVAQRETYARIINDEALAVGLGWVQPDELDTVGLSEAVSLAMHRALDAIKMPVDEIIIDGNVNYFPEKPNVQVVVRADDTVPAVSAASIVAKVARDRYMVEIAHAKYPEYAFDRHVGYGTSLHQQLLKLYGVSDIHRKSFRPVQAIMAASL